LTSATGIWSPHLDPDEISDGVRMGVLERLERFGGCGRAQDFRKTGHIHAPAVGIVELRHQAAVGHGRRVAVAERAVVIQKGLEGCKALADEALHPGFLGSIATTGQLSHMADNAEIADRVDFHGNGIGELAHPVLAVDVFRHQGGTGRGRVQIFDDGQRLRQRLAVDNQRRQQALRVESEIVVFLMSPGQKVHRPVFGLELQQVERDAHTVARRGPPVVI
jgi:hypothetical protein